jgi:valyl-tRNA synthetase
LNSEDVLKRQTVLHCLSVFFIRALKLLHPTIPFVTEELWEKICPITTKLRLWGMSKPKSDILMKEEFPKFVEISEDQKKILHKFEKMQNLITEIRIIRKTYMIKDGEKLKVFGLVLDNSLNDFFAGSTNTICRLANLGLLTWIQNKQDKPKKVVTVVDAAFEIYLDISKFIDANSEKARLNKEIEKTTKQTQALNQRLQNPGFLQSAKPEIVAEQKQKLSEDQNQLAKLQTLLQEIEGW